MKIIFIDFNLPLQKNRILIKIAYSFNFYKSYVFYILISGYILFLKYTFIIDSIIQIMYNRVFLQNIFYINFRIQYFLHFFYIIL